MSKINRKYKLLGLLLFSNSLLFTLTPSVFAEENPNKTQESSSDSLRATGHAGLDQTIRQTQAEGIIVLEDDPIYTSSQSQANTIYQEQAEIIDAVRKDYQSQQENYRQEQTAYETYLSEVKTYQDNLANYQDYLIAEQDYQTKLNQYQQEEKAYQEVVKDNQERELTYQKALDTYKQEEKDYQVALAAYKQEVADNQEKVANHQKELADYDQELSHYQRAKASYDQTKAEEEKLLADYQEKLKIYQQDHKEWELEKALYDEKVKEAEKTSLQDGYLSQVHAQYLIFKSEPNASVSFEGVESFFDASHDFGNALTGIGGNPKDIKTSSHPSLAKNAGGLTAAGAGDGYGLFLKKNQPITVTYTGLEKSSYKGRPITKVVYTFELLSTFASDNLATAFIYTDPTKTIYTGSYGANTGGTDFTIRQTVSYYYTDEEIVVLDEQATSLISLASLNNTFEFGEQEFVRLSEQMTFIPITGSSVSADGRIVASKGSNNSRADGSRFDRSEWDKDGHDNEYYEAGVAKIVGSSITFDFGIRYSQENINRSANPSQLRNASRIWFAVNTDLKAAGILEEGVRAEPVAPPKPKLNPNPKEPQAPIKPTEPRLTQPVKPKQPTEPQPVQLADLPKKPVAPQKPKSVAIPKAPKPVQEPSLPDIPVIYYQRVIILVPAKVQTTSHQKAEQTTSVQARSQGQASQPTRIRVSYLPQEQSRPVSYGAYQPVYPANNSRTIAVTTTGHASKKRVLPKLPEPKVLTMKKTPSLMEKEVRDKQVAQIQKNTNMTRDEQEIFFGYLDEVKKLAIKKYGYNNKDKINHAIANAIAGVVYQDDFKQKVVNDFNSSEFKKLPGYKEFSNLVKNSASENSEKFYTIDLAHLAMPMATRYSSSWYKEVVKIGMTIGNSNHQRGLNWKDIFFWLNSYTGDKLTTFGHKGKDLPTDIDAWNIHKLYPRNTFLDDNIRDYYGKDLNRDNLLSKTGIASLKELSKSKFNIAATNTIGALAIIVFAGGLSKIGLKLQDTANKITSFFSNLRKKKKSKQTNQKTTNNNSRTKSSNSKDKNSKSKSSNSKVKNSKAKNNKTKSSNSKVENSKAKNNKTKSSNNKAKNNNSKAKSTNNKAKNNNNKAKSTNNKAKNNNSKAKSANNKAKNNNNKAKSTNNKAKNNNSKAKSTNNKAKNNSNKVKTSNNKTKTKNNNNSNNSKSKSSKKRR